MKDIDKLRCDIDNIDNQICDLFQERMKKVCDIAYLKKDNNINVAQNDRESAIQDRVQNRVSCDLKPYTKKLFDTLFEVSKDYQKNLIKNDGIKFCLIGKKLSHSWSEKIFEMFSYKYDLCEFDSLENIRQFLLNSGYCGFNVTIPYKSEIIKYLDVVDDTIKEIGAVNTIVKRDNKLYGYNTDILGMRYALSVANINCKNKKVLILGSGGTSKTAQYLLKKEGARDVVVCSRRGDINYQNVYDIKDVDIIINTTPVGMFDNNDDIPLDITCFKNLKGVFDVVYNPLKTRLVDVAESLNIPADNGLSMLCEQARCAKDLFLNEQSKSDDTKSILTKLKSEMQNIVLIGMPGVGKSTIGRALATLLGKKFVDTDCEIERIYHKKPCDIIKEKGEALFREYESEVVKNISKELGQVIATGGGCPLLSDNIKRLRQNGKIIWLKRDIGMLSTENRPLSQGNLEDLYKNRECFYDKAKDLSFDVLDNLEDSVWGIKELL